jgi:dihydroorotate dehydrogenase (fumarate)
MSSLHASYLGLNLSNPIVAGSSGLTGDIDSLKKLEDAGIGGVVLKSLFEEQILLEVRRENANGGVIYGQEQADEYLAYYERKHQLSAYLDLVSSARKELSIPVIASINCVSDSEWTSFAGEIESAGAAALQLNIFSTLCKAIDNQDEQERCSAMRVASIIKAVKSKIGIPVIAKICSFHTDLYGLVTTIEKAGADGVVLFNRPYSVDFNTDTLSLKPGSYFSSHEEMSVPLRWTSMLYSRIKSPIMASTGIQDGDDVIKMVLAGAIGVEVVSTLYRNSLAWIENMRIHMSSWMDRHGYETLEDFRGLMSQARSGTPDVYERVQYMKSYGETR